MVDHRLRSHLGRHVSSAAEPRPAAGSAAVTRHLPAPGSQGSQAPGLLLAFISFLFIVLPVVWQRMSFLFFVEKHLNYSKMVLLVYVSLQDLSPVFSTFPHIPWSSVPSLPSLPCFRHHWPCLLHERGAWKGKQLYRTAQNSVAPSLPQSDTAQVSICLCSDSCHGADSCWA